MMQSVLDGVRVIDLGQFVAGPFCAMLLADLGAEVIRVEPPFGAEDRRMGLIAPNGDSYTYMSCARNKKAISLHLAKGAEANELMQQLVKRADVVVQSYSPKTAETLGVTYEKLTKIKPDIILVNVSLFNKGDPGSERPGFDMSAKAMSGTMWASGSQHDPPVREQVSYIDFGTGMLGAVGVVAALYARKSTGRGQEINLSLMQTALTYTATYIAEWDVNKVTRERVGNRSQWTGPSDVYQTKDGRWIFLAVITNPIWKRFCRFIGREDLIDDPELHNDLARWNHRQRLDPVVTEWVATKTLEEVIEACEKIPVPYGVCLKPTEVAQELDVFGRGMMVRASSADESVKVPVIGSLIKMSDTPMHIEPTFPMIGQHNEEIYCGLLGYDREYIEKLAEKGIV